jgi:pimeloyl-ACP methyl ester carboxylesterase
MAEEFGIHPYHQSAASLADLVLVHGLMGNSTDTWTGKDDKGQPTYWPDWIKEVHPNVNIWRADYDSSLDAWLHPAMSLDQIAASLLVNAQDQGLGTRPIHWVGHSMGGLVIKHLLCRAQTRMKPGLHNIARVPTAITFLGTPHHGSDVADWKGYFGSLLTALDLFVTGGAATGTARFLAKSAEKARNQEFESHADQLSVHSRELGRLNDEFAQWLGSADRARRLVEARNYYETRPVKNLVVVVPERSARLSNVAIEDIPAQEHHLSICKYSSQRNTVFTGVLASLKALCDRPVMPDEAGPSRQETQDPPELPHLELESSPQAGDRADLLDGNENGMSLSQEVQFSGRQVFICHAANDPQWADDEVERFADVVRQAGLAVRLDIWHKRDSRRDLSPDEWRVWMKDSLNTSTNIVCLISPKYRRLWDRNEADAGGFGVAYEAIRVVHALYRRKQHNRGWILTLRQERDGFDVIPDDLAPDCVHYQWRSDLEIVVSHLAHAELSVAHEAHSGRPGKGKPGVMGEDSEGVAHRSSAPVSESGQALSSSDHCRKTQRHTLDHQAQCAIERLENAPAFWAALHVSRDFRDWCGDEKLASPRSFVSALLDWSPDDVTKIMWGLCDIYKSMQGRQSELDEKVAASATVACIVVCACRTIELRSAGLLARLPEVSDLEAAKLLCGLIALVMRGGRLELVVGNGDYPVARNTFEVQCIDQSQKASFKRQLLREVVKKSSFHHEALKVGDLSEVAEKHLDSQIRAKIDWARGFGSNRTTACVVVLSGDLPDESVLKFIAEFDLPMFHLSADAVHDVTGMDEEYLAECLKSFWADVSSSMRQERAERQALQSHLVDLIRALTALAESQPSSPISSDIQTLAEAFQKAADEKQAPNRDLLDRWNGLAGKLNQFGDESQKLVDRLASLFRFVYSII